MWADPSPAIRAVPSRSTNILFCGTVSTSWSVEKKRPPYNFEISVDDAQIVHVEQAFSYIRELRSKKLEDR